MPCRYGVCTRRFHGAFAVDGDVSRATHNSGVTARRNVGVFYRDRTCAHYGDIFSRFVADCGYHDRSFFNRNGQVAHNANIGDTLFRTCAVYSHTYVRAAVCRDGAAHNAECSDIAGGDIDIKTALSGNSNILGCASVFTHRNHTGKKLITVERDVIFAAFGKDDLQLVVRDDGGISPVGDAADSRDVRAVQLQGLVFVIVGHSAVSQNVRGVLLCHLYAADPNVIGLARDSLPLRVEGGRFRYIKRVTRLIRCAGAVRFGIPAREGMPLVSKPIVGLHGDRIIICGIDRIIRHRSCGAV